MTAQSAYGNEVAAQSEDKNVGRDLYKVDDRHQSLHTSENAGKTEWTSTLLLVEEACEAIKASEERVETLELELEAQSLRSREERRLLELKLIAIQQEVAKNEALVKNWQTRALEAEGWLARLNDALVANFGNPAGKVIQGAR